jgi:hypothetical protein
MRDSNHKYAVIDTAWLGVVQEVDTDLTEKQQRETMDVIWLDAQAAIIG